MADAIQGYLELSPSQQQSSEAAAPALARLFSALAKGQEPTTEQRRKLLAALLASVSTTSAPDVTSLLPLCSTLKFLGRNPAGSEELGRENGLRKLLYLGGLCRVAEIPRKDVSSETTERKDDDDQHQAAKQALDQREEDPLEPHEAEALRCLCNVLMLHPSSRDVFPDVLLSHDKRLEVKGMLRILGCEKAGFLGGRLLFFLTTKPSEAVTELVLGADVIDILQEYANRYLAISRSATLEPQLTSGLMPKPEDVLREHLKLAYNLMLQYTRSQPSSMEGNTSRRGSRGDVVDKKKRRFWPSRQASTTSEAASQQQDDPVEDGEGVVRERRDSAAKSFAKRVVGAVKSGSHHSPSANTPTTLSSSPTSTPTLDSTKKLSSETNSESSTADSLSLTSAHLFLPIFRPYLALAVSLPLHPPSATPKEPSPTVRSALNTLLNFPIELEEFDGSEYSWIQYVPPRTDKEGIVLRAGGIGSLGERLLDLLQTTCNAYFPVDSIPPKSNSISLVDRETPISAPAGPDDWIPTGQGEASKIEEILGPVMLLLRKLSMIGEANEMFRFVLFPPNIDRSKPVDRHPTLTGHLVRLLSSVFLPNTAFGVGEFLYNLSERSPEKLCALIGYGNASGFLQNRGELIPPPPLDVDGSSTPSSRPINPITGAFEPAEDPNIVPMSEEEKEKEAEKLYTLFDRMSRTGVMSAENPVHKARQEGRFEETSEERESELERLRKEDEEVEKEVAKDMAEWRARKGKGAASSSS